MGVCVCMFHKIFHSNVSQTPNGNMKCVRVCAGLRVRFKLVCKCASASFVVLKETHANKTKTSAVRAVQRVCVYGVINVSGVWLLRRIGWARFVAVPGENVSVSM